LVTTKCRIAATHWSLRSVRRAAEKTNVKIS
jgi:hypothetical protein